MSRRLSAQGQCTQGSAAQTVLPPPFDSQDAPCMAKHGLKLPQLLAWPEGIPSLPQPQKNTPTDITLWALPTIKVRKPQGLRDR
jgi:hypothetical protein